VSGVESGEEIWHNDNLADRVVQNATSSSSASLETRDAYG